MSEQVTAEALRAKTYSHQVQDLSLGVKDESVPSLDYLKHRKRKNALIIIDGCSGVGKTTLAGFLQMLLHFPIYQQIDFHTNLMDIWSEFVAISQLCNTDLQIIQDRSLVSWCYYHKDFAPTLVGWSRNLQKWDFAVVIHLTSNPSMVAENMQNKGEQYDASYTETKIGEEMTGMRELFGYVPQDILVEYRIEKYDNAWMWQIYENILGRMKNKWEL